MKNCRKNEKVSDELIIDDHLASLVAKHFGRIGGNTTLKKHGVKHFSEAGKKGMAKRWGLKKVNRLQDVSNKLKP
jgi:hypothetical protein